MRSLRRLSRSLQLGQASGPSSLAMEQPLRPSSRQTEMPRAQGPHTSTSLWCLRRGRKDSPAFRELLYDLKTRFPSFSFPLTELWRRGRRRVLPSCFTHVCGVYEIVTVLELKERSCCSILRRKLHWAVSGQQWPGGCHGWPVFGHSRCLLWPCLSREPAARSVSRDTPHADESLEPLPSMQLVFIGRLRYSSASFVVVLCWSNSPNRG